MFSFPYMVEMCGMKKVNGCEAAGWAQGGPAVQPEIATAPVGIAAVANLGQLGRLNIKKEMTQLTRKGTSALNKNLKMGLPMLSVVNTKAVIPSIYWCC